MAVAFDLAFALLALFVYVRIVAARPPLSWLAFWMALTFAAINWFFAHKFWAGRTRLPLAHRELPAIIPDAL